MSGNFISFLTGLARDPAKLSAFIRDPLGAMRAARLTRRESAILLSRDQVRIYEAIISDFPMKPAHSRSSRRRPIKRATSDGK